MTVSLQGFNKQVATFARAELEDGYAVEPGRLVKLSGNGEVTDCANGDLFIGLCVGVDGDHCAVQLSGYARVALAATGAPDASKNSTPAANCSSSSWTATVRRSCSNTQDNTERKRRVSNGI